MNSYYDQCSMQRFSVKCTRLSAALGFALKTVFTLGIFSVQEDRNVHVVVDGCPKGSRLRNALEVSFTGAGGITYNTIVAIINDHQADFAVLPENISREPIHCYTDPS